VRVVVDAEREVSFQVFRAMFDDIAAGAEQSQYGERQFVV
jgi:hypothetical protein